MSDVVIASAGAQLGASVAGEGMPVVLLHGLTATRRYVVMGSSALARSGHRVVNYDARGHGTSSPAPDGQGYDYPQLANDLLAILDGTGIERATLAGASMGAHTAIRFALDHPDRVAAVCAITPAFSPDALVDLQRWQRLADGLRADGIDGFVAAYPWAEMDQTWRTTVEKVVRQRLSQHQDLDALAGALIEVPQSRPFDAWRDLEALSVPALVVGSRDEVDPSHPLDVARRWSLAIRGAELLVEDEGKSPVAWQGGQLSRKIATLAARGQP